MPRGDHRLAHPKGEQKALPLPDLREGVPKKEGEGVLLLDVPLQGSHDEGDRRDEALRPVRRIVPRPEASQEEVLLQGMRQQGQSRAEKKRGRMSIKHLVILGAFSLLAGI